MTDTIPDKLACIDGINNYLYKNVPKAKTGRMVHIGVLRQTNSYNIFTTEGTELNLASTSAGIDGTEILKRVVMFKRKQVASERRTGKQKLRGLIKQHGDDAVSIPEAFGRFENDDDLCRLHDNLCGYCVDCKLYGFANADADGSRDSRVQTDSAFSVRGLERRSDITLNAQSESIEADSSTALNSRAHTRPETFFPSVVTLYDVTWEEVYWILHLLQETTRYGAETNRTGHVDNQIMAIWLDTTETISNLTLAKRMFDELQEDGEISDITIREARSAMLAALPNVNKMITADTDPTESESDVQGLLNDVAQRHDSDDKLISHAEAINAAQTPDKD